MGRATVGNRSREAALVELDDIAGRAAKGEAQPSDVAVWDLHMAMALDCFLYAQRDEYVSR